MSSVIINAHVFKQQCLNLLSLSAAIQDIGIRVLNLTSDLPEPIRGKAQDALERELTGIESTCHCLGVMALEAGSNAEEWQSWAEKTGTNLPAPLKSVATQAEVTGGIAEAVELLQGIQEQVGTVGDGFNHERAKRAIKILSAMEAEQADSLARFKSVQEEMHQGFYGDLRKVMKEVAMEKPKQESVTVEKVGRMIKQTFEAGYTEADGKMLSGVLQEIYMRIHPNAMNPAYPGLE